MKTINFAAAAALGAAAATAHAETTAQPYMKPVSPLVKTLHPFLTTGDTVGGYKLGGIPDGLGAHISGKGQVTLHVNHELGQTAGIARAHGGKGAYVSQWVLQPAFGPGLNDITINVNTGGDSFNAVQDWDDVNGGYVSVANAAFQRFCSAYLAGPHDGFTEYMFLTGEEQTGTPTMDGIAGGQAYAVIGNTCWALPRLGRFAKENQVAIPGTGDKTVVVALEDGSGLDSQLYVYVGDKVPASTDVLEKNGLSNGSLYVLKVSGIATEPGFVTKGLAVPFTLEAVNWALAGGALEAAADAAGATGFVRIEDGEYDPNNYNDFYFDTTGGSLGIPNGRLYRLSFTDIANPLLGGTITMLLDGTEGMVSPDNLGINSHGQILLQEDPNFTLVGRDASIWLYDIATTNLNRVVEMDTVLAQSLDPAYSNGKWESSGIIDATSTLGDGWWIYTVQAHYNIGVPELVEGGQLLALKIATAPIPGDVNGNGIVTIDDLLAVINGWGPCPVGSPCNADLTGDGNVNIDDLLAVINNWT